MGKRATNTTKSGKFMNPTDQARKEARKRELKKNKKQRLAVRTAVLKGKNPAEIVAELEKIDDMEFNPLCPPPLNDKVLKEKRRKLHETWNRVMRLYEKDNVEQYVELKKIWHAYSNRKHEVVAHFESVRNAQNVSVDDIPLPAPSSAASGDMDSIPLPPTSLLHHRGGILKKPSVLESLKPRSCPGVPSGPPPLLADYIDDEGTDKENSDSEETATAAAKNRKIRFDDEEKKEEVTPKVDDIQRRMLQMAGQDVDQYMKEMEEVHRQTQADKAVEMQTRLSRFEEPEPAAGGGAGVPEAAIGAPAFAPPMGAPMGMMPRPTILYRPAPPPLRPGMAPAGVRLPPGPPPGRPPVPPGPPPGRPPTVMAAPRPAHPPRPALPRPPVQNVVSAAPQLNKEGVTGVIEAKPQMRNLRSDITKFVPTNVRVRRDGGVGKRKQLDPLQEVFARPSPATNNPPQVSKDDAYAQFMKEMDQLMK